MLPNVKINFSNGALGSTNPSPDCVVGLVVTGAAVGDTFGLGKAYILYKMDDLSSLGVTEENNAFLYKHVKRFYDQAGDGAELWLMGVPETVKPSEILNKDASVAYAKNLIQIANGRLRCIGVAFKPATGYKETIQDGLDSDVMPAALNGQNLAEWATNSMFAPLLVLIEGRGFSNDKVAELKDLTECNYNRVGIMIGDTESDSHGAAIGLLAGRIASIPVHRHIGRVKDGALKILTAYIAGKDPSVANVETIHNKGFITLRTFTGKSGYFFTDDCLATAVTDDYRSIARRRSIDKAYRIVYLTTLDKVNDEIPVTDDGYLVPSMAKAWESDVITDIASQMGANGELGTDPNDPDDMGVKCFINPQQKVVATSKISVVAQIKPYGYGKYIDVELGFVTVNSEG